MRVLIVEDDATIRAVVTICLGTEGVAVHGAADGREGMRALVEDGPFDVLLVDVMMPGLSGLDLISAVRESARFADMPVVVLTALGREVDVTSGFQVGADAYVTKPFDPQRLLATLRKVVGRTPELRAAQRAMERAGCEPVAAFTTGS
jgi:DNA-binding response OmpR family regulator